MPWRGIDGHRRHGADAVNTAAEMNSVDRAFMIDRLEGIRLGEDVDFVERLSAVKAFPMMDGPVFEIKLEAVVVFLKEVRTTAKGTHDRFHHLSSDFRPSASRRLGENRF